MRWSFLNKNRILANALPHEAFFVFLAVKSVLEDVWLCVRFSLAVIIIARRVHFKRHDVLDSTGNVLFVANEISCWVKFLVGIGT